MQILSRAAPAASRADAEGNYLSPLAAWLEAFINAILRAPVRLALKPRRIANAGTKIIEATANPAPKTKPAVFSCWATTS